MKGNKAPVGRDVVGKDSGNVLLWVAIVLFVLSAVWLLYSYIGITGFASSDTATGTANVTVSAAADINFTTDNINWGAGRVGSGVDAAALDTSNNSVAGGTWTPVANGFVIENIGNVNVTLRLATGLNSTDFIGGTAGGGPAYRYRVTDAEAGSCVVGTDFVLGTYYDVNTTSPGTWACSVFASEDSYDTVEIDLQLIIPSDSKTGALGDTITATANSPL